MIFLLIKGDGSVALSAASVHNVFDLHLQETNQHGETTAVCEGRHLEKVKEWFLEDVNQSPPLRHGSLLYYAVRGGR